MARKRSIFFSRVQPLLKGQRKRWRLRIFLSLLTVLSIVVAPVAATIPDPTSHPPQQTAHVPKSSSGTVSSPTPSNLLQQGKRLYEAGQFAQAAEVLQRAAANFEADGEPLMEAIALSNLSLIHQQLGNWQQATAAITRSIDLLQDTQIKTASETAPLLAQALDIQGQLQFALSNPQNALTSWQQAAELYAGLDNQTGEIRSRINAASALQALGLYRQAQKTLKSAIEQLHSQPDSTLKVEGLRNFGNVLRVVGELERSRQVLEQSLAVAQKIQSPDFSNVLLALGKTAQVQQDSQAALDYYRKSATAATSSASQVEAQLYQLSLLVESQSPAASPLWQQINERLADLPFSQTTVYARIFLAQSLIEIRKNYATNLPAKQDIAQILIQAVQQAKELEDKRATSSALRYLGSLYELTGQEDEALALTEEALWLAGETQVPELAYPMQWQLGRLLKRQGDTQGAIAAYTEAVQNLQFLRGDLVTISSDVQFSFREEVEPVYRQLADLLLSQDETSQANLYSARSLIESLQLAELVNYFRENCLVIKSADFVDQKAALFYTILLDDRLEIILSLPGQELRHYPASATPKQVESLVEELRQNLILPYTSEQDILPLSQQMYDWLLKPAQIALENSEIETLVFVLDGPLRNLPMAALHDGEQYLVEKYALALTPSLQLFDPQPLAQGKLKALMAGLSKARFGFDPLLYVEQELEQIKSEIPAQILLNREFTSTKLDDEVSSSSTPIVHIATHGQFSSQAEDTFILAWDQPINVNQLDNVFQIRKDSQEALELLVLSACETAAGDERAALGMAGIAVRSGARSTLASLWIVDDESTAQLMSHFYKELNAGVTRGEALRRAQQTLLQEQQYNHPRYWAAFVLLGNWL